MFFDTRDLMVSQALFGADLLRALCAERPAENVFISPVSLFTALALAYNGARGDTAAAMAAGMRLEPAPGHDALNGALRDLLSYLKELDRSTAENARFGLAVTPADYKVWFQVACSLWLARDVPFEPAYIERVQAAYEAALAPADDAATINNWVAERTGGAIEAVLDQVEPARSYLVSAAYFRGGWALPFERSETRDSPFHLVGGGQRTLPMMRQEGKFLYDEDEAAQVILLPIGDARGGRAEVFFMVALPRPELGFAEFCASATAGWWRERYASAARGSQPISGELQLPRFRVEFAGELSAALSGLGMGRAFSEQADFGGLSPAPAHIKTVLHRTVLAVDEQGIEAAAASSVELRTFGAAGGPFTMRVDRPFLCALIAERTRAQLFTGAVASPEPTL